MFARRIARSSLTRALLIPAWFSAGCGEGPPPATDAAAAKQHLTATLDAWKSGSSMDDLSKQAPPLRVLDRDWERGAKVSEYRLEGEGQPLGASVQWPVHLTLTDPKGKTTQKRVVYVVNTGEVISVARQDADF